MSKWTLKRGDPQWEDTHCMVWVEDENGVTIASNECCNCLSLEKAHLIAAAPEMLEALKQLRDAMIRYMAGSETHLYEVTQANAAIAKAEGKAEGKAA